MRLVFFVVAVNFFAQFSYAEVILQEVLATETVLKKATDKTSLSLLAAGALSSLAVQPSDERLRDNWKNHQQMSRPIAAVGDFLGSGIAGTMILGGQYFFDDKKENWKSHARALIWESALVFAMKYSFGRPRPGNSKNVHSFPSGHTATAFATATSLTYSYGWKTGMLVYPVAVVVGLSRLADDAHWGSDVVAGAFVGFIMARASVLDSRQNSVSTETLTKSSSQTTITPILSPEFSGIKYVYVF